MIKFLGLTILASLIGNLSAANASTDSNNLHLISQSEFHQTLRNLKCGGWPRLGFGGQTLGNNEQIVDRLERDLPYVISNIALTEKALIEIQKCKFGGTCYVSLYDVDITFLTSNGQSDVVTVPDCRQDLWK